MLVKFTNASEMLKGNPLYINSDHVVSVFESPIDDGSLKTIIWGGPTGIGWEVEENLSQTIKIINAANAKTCGCK